MPAASDPAAAYDEHSTPGNAAVPGSYEALTEPAPSTPPRSENRARSQLVNIRVNADERERWTAFAQSKGMPLAGLLRLATEAAILQDQIVQIAEGKI